jgi:hypothetical protein
VQHMTLRLNGIRTTVRAMRSTLVVAGLLSLALAGLQVGSAPSAQASGSWLYYRQGYYVDSGWLCYGWPSGMYHCTRHWHHAADGRLVSDNPRGVPNGAWVAPADPPAHPAMHHVSTHAAPPPSAPSPTTISGTSGVVAQINQVFGPYAAAARAVAACESGFNPNARNSYSGAAGVFQFLPGTWRGTSYAAYSPFNAGANIRAAYQVFQRDGYSWREWVCQP